MRLVVVIVAALMILGLAALGLVLASQKGGHPNRNGGFDWGRLPHYPTNTRSFPP
jgi:hypothetical protein